MPCSIIVQHYHTSRRNEAIAQA